MASELLQIVDRFVGRRILLVGDFMLDRYVFGDAERISPEAPVPVLRVIERDDRVGGAGSVALNLAALGARARCVGVVGHDRHGERVRSLLEDAGVDASGLQICDDRPTITKTRLVGLAEHRHRQQLLRVDEEDVRPLRESDERRLLNIALEALKSADAVCLEDYAKGVLGKDVCEAIIDAARERKLPVLVDPARSVDWARYRGATLMTPNRAELEAGIGRRLVSDEEVRRASEEVVSRLELDALVVTLGRDGALLTGADRSHRQFPTRPRAVYDNTGAGDAVLAMMAVALAAGAELEQAVPLANIAGGLEVSKFGCVPIDREEVVRELTHVHEARRGKLRSVAELVEELAVRRRRGETVVFTNGCFDLLHPGHVELLEQSRALGSLLVVGMNSDASVRAQGKGDDRPIRDQHDRARMLAALEAVDYVVVFDEPSVLSLIEKLAPDVLVKGGDYDKAGVVGGGFVESRGGRVELIPFVTGHGTTDELARIRNWMQWEAMLADIHNRSRSTT